MAPRYERVNLHDADNYDDSDLESLASSPTAPEPARRARSIPNSPPPSFHSRASSPTASFRSCPVDPALADAFDSGDDDSSDNEEADVRQRLVRRSTTDTARSATPEAATPPATSSTPLSGAHAQLVPRQATTPFRVYGSGIQSDGVFSNLSARPESGSQEEKEEQPPSYEQAAADQAPPYWETTILAPGLGGPDEVYLDGMPVGSLFSFMWNAMISTSFQLVGFLLTYLLHSSHAAKNGSRAGLGVTLIQYGFYLKGAPPEGTASPNMSSEGYAVPNQPNAHDVEPGHPNSSSTGIGIGDISASDWLSYIMMVVGWFVLIKAISDYLRARRHEMLVMGSPGHRFGVDGVFAEGEMPDRVV